MLSSLREIKNIIEIHEYKKAAPHSGKRLLYFVDSAGDSKSPAE
jgi:hypothetical protein